MRNSADFGQFARLKRENADISQEDVAHEMGYKHRSEISRKETGLSNWKLWECCILASMLDIPLSQLMAEWEKWAEGLPSSTGLP